jgi:diazepam-binding inhibitor (GABA receptor modulator, acyl-CoA-binding protein)
MALEDDFQKASQDVQTLTERPSNEDLLSLYAYFKQATEGDISGERPGGFDFKAIAKFNAWEKLKGMPTQEAMQQYINLVNRLKNS